MIGEQLRYFRPSICAELMHGLREDKTFDIVQVRYVHSWCRRRLSPSCPRGHRVDQMTELVVVKIEDGMYAFYEQRESGVGRTSG